MRALDAKFKARQKAGYDRRHGVKSLPDLQPGEPVLVKLDGQKGWNQPAVVKQKLNVAPRSYIVETAGGGQLRRNRRHLRPDTAHVPGAVTSPRATSEQGQHVIDPSRVDDNPGRRKAVGQARHEMSRGQARGLRGNPPGQRANTPPGRRANTSPGRRNTSPGRRTVTSPRRRGAPGRRAVTPERRADPEPTQSRRAETPERRADSEPPEDQPFMKTPTRHMEQGSQGALDPPLPPAASPYRTRAGRRINKPIPYSP